MSQDKFGFVLIPIGWVKSMFTLIDENSRFCIITWFQAIIKFLVSSQTPLIRKP